MNTGSQARARFARLGGHGVLWLAWSLAAH